MGPFHYADWIPAQRSSISPRFPFFFSFFFFCLFDFRRERGQRAPHPLVMYLPLHQGIEDTVGQRTQLHVRLMPRRPIVSCFPFIRRDWIWMIELMSALMNLNNAKSFSSFGARPIVLFASEFPYIFFHYIRKKRLEEEEEAADSKFGRKRRRRGQGAIALAIWYNM